MTAPSDFLDLFRWEEEGGAIERTEENWDEPRVDRDLDDEEGKEPAAVQQSQLDLATWINVQSVR